MEKCVHVSKIRPAWDHSILNPEKWLCFSCRTTESVWACLSCSNVACGRFNEQHALKHFKESKHPISIEVNDKYVYCYVCDDYVLNDNAAGDLKLLRSALSAIATQKFTDIESRGRRLLRSYSHTGVIKRDLADDDDKVATADWHQRQRLLGRVFGAWRTYVSDLRLVKKKSSKRTKNRPEPSTSLTWKKRRIQPGVTGLRNLGNTCYMNSVLQVLSHINAFRDFFLSLKDSFYSSPGISPQVSSIQLSNKPAVKSPPTKPSSKLFIRQSTVECFEHLMSTRSQTQNPMPQKKVGGLNGGSSSKSISGRKPNIICEVESKGSDDKIVSLCSELHGLFRVLWSGKWTQVSPHAFLRAVWQGIPLFKGYAQHDAQEFLCELLDKVQREMDCVPPPLRREDAQLVTELFQGELVSQVTCLSCGNQSQTKEPFLDLSLEFPDRYQITKQNSRIAQDVCHLTEMLAKFTEVEHLEGPIYACEKCNSKRGKQKEKIYTEAKKQLLINRLPQILRLHLKRFRWSGRNHREKISTHVAVDENLNLVPFSVTSSCSTSHEYQLFAVIIHHGKGFGSGHYTAYTYNPHAECWVNCNDSRMILSSIDDVLLAQAYILFYRAVTNKLPLLTRLSSSNCSLASSTDTLPYDLVTDNTLILDKADSEVSEKQTRGSNTSKPYNSSCKQPVKKRRQQGKDSLDRLSKSESVVKTDSVLSVDRDGNEEDYVEIDSEVSFKSNSSSFTHIDLTDSSFGQHSALGLKRKHEESKDSPELPPKKKQKMSISTEAFYKPKPEGSSDGGSRGSRFMSSFGSKLSDFISKLSKQCEKSPPRVKRTKSSFW